MWGEIDVWEDIGRVMGQKVGAAILCAMCNVFQLHTELWHEVLVRMWSCVSEKDYTLFWW